MAALARISAVCLFLLAGLTMGGAAEAQSRKLDMIRELLETSQTEALLREVLPDVLQHQKAVLSEVLPEVPEEVWDLALKEAEAAFRESIDAFLEQTIPIYDAYLTEEEVAALLAFYRTPEGRSVVQKLPLVTQEAMGASHQWGMAVGEEVRRRIIDRLKAEGYRI
ncbi:DUF2059 domain-containing protein [Pelagibius sp. CAU 1746]|uniref:DUF2059 domain-containing protein n=1 Tax=Pelagibius sp. CAU 1746 TaxID=3140370 RepID=UPI00325A99A8